MGLEDEAVRPDRDLVLAGKDAFYIGNKTGDPVPALLFQGGPQRRGGRAVKGDEG